MAESVNGLYKTECVWREEPWRGRAELELATASWVAWWNDERLHSELGYVPPTEFEELHYRQKPPLPRLESNSRGLHQTQGGSKSGQRDRCPDQREPHGQRYNFGL